MFELGAALIQGGASMYGNMQNAQQSARNTAMQIEAQEGMQQMAMHFNHDEAQIARDYQTQMSNTAYQRSRADMQAAGLNPILAAGAGGASTPSSPSPSVSTPTAPMPQNQSPWANMGDVVSKAINTAISMKTMDKMTNEIANLKATENLTVASEKLRSQETKTEEQETTKRMNEAALRALALPGARISARQAEALEKMPDWFFNTVVQGGFAGGKISDTLAPISDLISSARGLRSMMLSRSTRETTRTDTNGHGSSTFEELWSNRAH